MIYLITEGRVRTEMDTPDLHIEMVYSKYCTHMLLWGQNKFYFCTSICYISRNYGDKNIIDNYKQKMKTLQGIYLHKVVLLIIAHRNIDDCVGIYLCEVVMLEIQKEPLCPSQSLASSRYRTYCILWFTISRFSMHHSVVVYKMMANLSQRNVSFCDVIPNELVYKTARQRWHYNDDEGD